MSSHRTIGAAVHTRGWKQELPPPVPIRIGELHAPRLARERHAHRVAEVNKMARLHPGQVGAQGWQRNAGERNAPILVSLPAADHNLTAIEVDVLHA